MFDSIFIASTESNDTLFNPGSTGDADPGLHRTASRRRRVAGRGRIAGPRDPRGSRLPNLHRRGRLNRGREGLLEE